MTTEQGTAAVASIPRYRPFGPLLALDTPVLQTAGGHTRGLGLRLTYRSDDSISQLDWSLREPLGTPIAIVKQTMGYTPAGLTNSRTDAGDIVSSRYYAYDSLLRMTCGPRIGQHATVGRRLLDLADASRRPSHLR